MTRIGIVGGTGQMGMGLALRWAVAGHEVLLGSRDVKKAKQAALEVMRRTGTSSVEGMGLVECAAKAEVVVVSVPYEAHAEVLRSIREAANGKIVVDVCVPMNPNNRREVLPPPEGSAVQEAQAILGPAIAVVGAFQNVSFLLLQQYDQQIDCDILVCGNSQAAREAVMNLVNSAGLRSWDVGDAKQARTVEGLTTLLYGLNRDHHSRIAGIRITNLTPQQGE